MEDHLEKAQIYEGSVTAKTHSTHLLRKKKLRLQAPRGNSPWSRVFCILILQDPETFKSALGLCSSQVLYSETRAEHASFQELDGCFLNSAIWSASKPRVPGTSLALKHICDGERTKFSQGPRYEICVSGGYTSLSAGIEKLTIKTSTQYIRWH